AGCARRASLRESGSRGCLPGPAGMRRTMAHRLLSGLVRSVRAPTALPFRHAARLPLTAALGPRVATDGTARGVLADREDHRLLPGAARAHDPRRGDRRPEAAV